ncbi:MAG: hypothetical protein LBR26_04760 [Prevotella sp.]|jgi:hypothetical protein|nr:hypothetical protein [Prevotella sp.]
MKKILMLLVLCLTSVSTLLNAQSKIAVFDPEDPEGNVSKDIKSVIREEISSIIVNNPAYLVLERANFDKVVQEYQFQGNYSDNPQELGKKMGAKYVCVIVVVQSGYNYTIYCKQIDVVTAEVVKQGEGKAYAVTQIPFAAKEAAIIFAANPEAVKREIAQKRTELGKARAKQLEAQEQARKEASREAKKELNKSNYNYLGLGFGTGVSCGTFGIGIVGRHGGVVGVGYEGGIGFRSAEGGSYFHYGAGLRLYPFKFIYFSVNYGVLGATEIADDYTSDGHFSMAGTKILGGVSFLGGVSLKFTGSALTLGAGFAYPDAKFDGEKMFTWNAMYVMTF